MYYIAKPVRDNDDKIIDYKIMYSTLRLQKPRGSDVQILFGDEKYLSPKAELSNGEWIVVNDDVESQKELTRVDRLIAIKAKFKSKSGTIKDDFKLLPATEKWNLVAELFEELYELNS